MEKGLNDNGDLLSSIIDQRIKSLFKSFLSEIEDIKFNHQKMIEKIQSKTDETFVSNVDYFTEAKFENIRKKVLDQGNDCIREIDSAISYFDCNFNQGNFEKTNKQTKIIKKVFAPIIYEK